MAEAKERIGEFNLSPWKAFVRLFKPVALRT